MSESLDECRPATPKDDLLEGSISSVEGWLQARGKPGFHAKQIEKWVYHRSVARFEEMTDLSESLRAELAAAFSIFKATEVESSLASGGTSKRLLRWPDGGSTETVMIPASDRGRARRTVCLSTQVGCDVGCRFCASGIGGALRNLTVGEVMEQALRIAGGLSAQGERLTHAVFMGMGEPLANYDVTLAAVRQLSDRMGISKRRITVSTVGLPKQIRRLADDECQATLALSLHAPTAELRSELIPWAESIELPKVLDACEYYFESSGRELTLEYCLLSGVNDRPDDALELSRIARRLRAHVNLMMYNPVQELPFERPTKQHAIDFLHRLRDLGARAHLRHSRGLDADAACGQLRRRHEETA